MKPKPPVVRVLDASLYTKIVGDLRKALPGKVIMDVNRAVDADGKKIVLLRCRYPEVARKAIAEVLGEEYQEPEVDEDALLAPRRDWYCRSMDSLMGGYVRDPVAIQDGISSYARQFQSGIAATRKRMFGEQQEQQEQQEQPTTVHSDDADIRWNRMFGMQREP